VGGKQRSDDKACAPHTHIGSMMPASSRWILIDVELEKRKEGSNRAAGFESV
jgi:hypothetical protein